VTAPSGRFSGLGPIRRRITGASKVLGRFTDRYPFFGSAFWMLAITFFVAQVAVAYSWQSRPREPRGIVRDHPYSFFANTISDLGETAKFTYGRPRMWSPDHVWMDVAFVLLGVVMIAGTPFIYQEFNENTRGKVWVARIGFSAQALAGAGAITVGFVPENVNDFGHKLGAGLAIGVGTLGVLLLGLSIPLPGRIRRFMLWCMPVSLVAILLFAIHEYLGFGPGGMERIAAYPEVIWLIMFGFSISRSNYSHGSAHRPAGQAFTTTWLGRSFTVNQPQEEIFSRLRLPAAGRLPRARRTFPYSVTIHPLGGTGQERTFTPKTPMPADLDLSSDGTISGILRESGFRRLKVAVTDGSSTAEKTFTLPVGR
jgi:hypothetical membrane protein